MQKYQDVVIDLSGNAVSGASVSVTSYSTGAAASIFDDNGAAITNPITSGSDGRFAFSAADGLYTITATKGSVSLTLSKVQLYDATSASATVLALGTISTYSAKELPRFRPNPVRHLAGIFRTR